MPGANSVWHGSQSGAYGVLPYAEIEKKFEQTCLYEPDDQLDVYNRGILRDTGPDSLTLASDQQRNGRIDPDTGLARNAADARDTLTRHYTGQRFWLEPDHGEMYIPDQQFSDPRGTALGPDFRRAANQSWMRSYDQNLRPDNDDSVPESGRGPRAVLIDKMAGFYPTKERMRIFASSKDNFAAGRRFIVNPDPRSPVILTTPQAALLDLNSVLSSNLRRDFTTTLSNKLPVGYAFGATPTNQFETSSYGQLRRAQYATVPQRSRVAATVDQEYVQYGDYRVPRGLALSMAHLALSRKARQHPGETAYGTVFVVDPRPVPFPGTAAEAAAVAGGRRAVESAEAAAPSEEKNNPKPPAQPTRETYMLGRTALEGAERGTAVDEFVDSGGSRRRVRHIPTHAIGSGTTRGNVSAAAHTSAFEDPRVRSLSIHTYSRPVANEPGVARPGSLLTGQAWHSSRAQVPYVQPTFRDNFRDAHDRVAMDAEVEPERDGTRRAGISARDLSRRLFERGQDQSQLAEMGNSVRG